MQLKMRTNERTVGSVAMAAAWPVLLLLGLKASAHVQEADAPPPIPNKGKGGSGDWKFGAELSAQVGYTDNLFLLKDSTKDRLEAGDPADAVSGRFRDMNSVADILLAAELSIHVRGPGVGGKRMELAAAFRNLAHFENPACDYVEWSAIARQSLGGGAGRLGIRVEWIPRRFVKNYLADATDPVGTVSDDERVYRRGEYEQLDIGLEYRIPFVETSKSDGGLGLEGSAELRLRERTYDAPFSGRDRDAWALGLGVAARLGGKSELSCTVTFEDSRSPTANEVMILDESDYGVDFNADGDATDPDVRTVQAVNRSFEEVAVRLALKLPAGEVSEIRIWTEQWRTEYSSNHPFDEDHRGRKDARMAYGSSIRFKLGKGVETRLTAEYARQDTSRPADPGATGEVSDYDRFAVGLAIEYRW